MDEASRQQLRGRFRAVGSLWICWAVAYALSEAALAALAALRGDLAGELSVVAGSTVAAASAPLMEKMAAVKVPLSLQIAVVNTLGLLLVSSMMPLLQSMADPKPRGALAERFDRLMWTHPALKWTNYVAYLFWPSPTFRRTPTLKLKGLVSFGVLPYLLPLLLGLQAGLVGAGLQDARSQHPVAVTLVGLALVLPHGVIELTGLFIPVAALLQFYRLVRPMLIAGDVDGISAAVREHATWKAAARWLPLSLALVAIAAVIEANLTLRIAQALARVFGLAVGDGG